MSERDAASTLPPAVARAVLGQMGDGIVIADMAGRITYANAAARRLHGVDELGQRIEAHSPEFRLLTVDGDDFPAERLPLYRALGGEIVRDVLVRVQRPDRSEVVLQATAAPLCDESDQRIGAVVGLRDVTLQREVAEERERLLDYAESARREAVTANEAKSQFLATMSHELRTPLNAVLGYTELLDLGIAGDVSEQQRDYLQRMRGSAAHLLGLITDVLDLAKAETGQLDVRATPMKLDDVVRAAVELLGPQATMRELVVEGDAEGDAESDVLAFADPDRVRQILLNVLSNALKFTPPGGRVVVASGVAVDAATGRRRVFARVTDSGIGIPAERQAQIFEPFVQVEGTLTRRHGGSGLGLAISRELARLMGGDITVRSTPGEGATFTLWLPSVRGRRDTPPRAETLPRDTRREIGRVLAQVVPAIVAAYSRRLVLDPAVSAAKSVATADLEDHVASILADFAQALVILDDAEADRIGLIRDGSALQHLIATQHGAQRRRLGWDRAALQREFVILDEEVTGALRTALGALAIPVAAVDDYLALLRQFLREAAVTSLRGFEAANSDVAA